MKVFSIGEYSVGYSNGFLWKLMRGGNELVRMVYFALRDENWGTYPLMIRDEQIHQSENSFRVSYTAFNTRNEANIFQWSAVIEADNTGKIIFDLTGTSLTDVLKNRAGFCFHHPVKQLKDAPCEVGDSAGSISRRTFPGFIAPDNPFKNINSMQYTIGETKVYLQFDGDVFEMEDQRNWTDASFKTFCTPLDRPFPVLMKEGETIHQRVTLQIETASGVAKIRKRSIGLTRTSRLLQIPSIGTGASTETLSPQCVDTIKDLALSHYRIEAHTAIPDWEKKLYRQLKNTATLGLAVELAYLHDGNNESLRKIQNVLLEYEEVKQVALFSHERAATEDFSYLASNLRKLRRNLAIGGGTLYNFAELNRNRFNASWLDYIAFSIHPQEHSFDDLTILENVEAHYDAVESAQQIYPGKKIRISPLTLKKRYNPYATRDDKRIVPPNQQNDPRQHTRFASLFMLGSIKHLALAGTTSVTLFEAIGDRGLITSDGQVSDCYQWLRVLTSNNVAIYQVESSEPLVVDALLIKYQSENKETLLAWNYSEHTQEFKFNGKIFSLDPRTILMKEV